MLTIVRVLTATNEIASKKVTMRLVVNDEELDTKSEAAAWEVLRRLVAAELLDLELRSSSPAKKRQKKRQKKGRRLDDGWKERQSLLSSLRDARKKVLLSSSSAVEKKCRDLSR